MPSLPYRLLTSVTLAALAVTALVGQTPRAGQAQGQSAPAAPLGLTVASQVKNYVPVTDEMLRNPDPGDWLMIRRNYQAWSYSPLDEITRENVG